MAWFEPFTTAVRTDAAETVDIRGKETTSLKAHLRMAEEAVLRRRAAFAELAAEGARLGAERARALADCARLESDIRLALSGNRKDLARYALRLLLRRQQVGARIEQRLTHVTKDQRTLEVLLARQQAALEALRARVQLYLTDWEADHFDASAAPITDEEVELELLRRTGADASAPADQGATTEAVAGEA